MSEKKVHMKYYAALREERGLSEETVATQAGTAAELYEELQQIYHFRLKRDALRVAINNEYAAWHDPVQDQDAVVFVPPVNGG